MMSSGWIQLNLYGLHTQKKAKERKLEAVQFSIASLRSSTLPSPNPGRLRGNSGGVPVPFLW